ncbi:hypothetical protein D3C76_1728280 [compost metagenome]|uniref:hypothetical protein n=1 Tax=Pseudomonas TaxID=286 RepID=UPI0003AEC4AD|nr:MULTISPECIES: hypothetical protein [Pseudomonas]WHH50650.1 hypothetical protein QFA96_23315 [Pseudomonas sp. Ap32]AOX08605.1 hypothetical protein Q5O_09460 [Pseudomonas putida JB]EKT4454387.1 hypothetical protein [Pseudomonas putida]EKT4511202.1 hypothetical protein [Pseudomonas putida]ERL02452.1 hypothetical protein O999_05965 [Pseudomonas putida LF54]
MTTFIMEYRVIGYSLAHAFSTNPKAGKRIFSVSSDDIGSTDILAVMDAARSPENTPDGYKLFSVTDRDAAKVMRP